MNGHTQLNQLGIAWVKTHHAGTTAAVSQHVSLPGKEKRFMTHHTCAYLCSELSNLSPVSCICSASDSLLCMQSAESLLQVVYKNYQLSIAQTLSSSTDSIQSLTDKGSTATVALSTTSGCGRDSSGSARLEFVVNYNNISAEEAGVGAKRRMLSTPCSATDGTSVGMHTTLSDVCMALPNLSLVVHLQVLLLKQIGPVIRMDMQASYAST